MDDKKTGVDLDLDALAPKQVQINYKGKIIKVNPLDLVMFSKLYDLSSEMAKIKKVADPKQVLAIYGRVEEFVKEALPEFKDEKLNNLQLTALFDLLSKLNTPQDKALAELKKRGIELNKDGGKSDPKALTS